LIEASNALEPPGQRGYNAPSAACRAGEIPDVRPRKQPRRRFGV